WGGALLFCDTPRRWLMGAGPGGIGAAIVFVCPLLGIVVVGSSLLAYAAHVLLVVVTRTAVGEDDVSWPDDPMLDWLLGAVHLWLVTVLWLCFIGLLARLLKDVLFPADGGLRFLVVAVPGMWLCFPIGVLSSLTGESRWTLLRPRLVWQMCRVPGATLLFYGASALLGVGLAAVWYAAITKDIPILLPLAAVATASAW